MTTNNEQDTKMPYNEEDKENWQDRAEIITKHCHETYTEYAKEVVKHIVEQVPAIATRSVLQQVPSTGTQQVLAISSQSAIQQVPAIDVWSAPQQVPLITTGPATYKFHDVDSDSGEDK